MYRGTKDIMLPTTITGSLPRPSWYTENLGTRMFLDAMVSRRYREQYIDTLSCYLRDQELAGLDIVTDGDCRFDDDVGGQSWTSYPPHHMSGFDATHPKLAKVGAGGIGFPRGHILHDYLEARVMPYRLQVGVIAGPVAAVAAGECLLQERQRLPRRLSRRVRRRPGHGDVPRPGRGGTGGGAGAGVPGEGIRPRLRPRPGRR